MQAVAPSRPETPPSSSPPPLGVAGTAVIFGAAGLLLYAVTHQLIPVLAARMGMEPVLLWFLLGGLGVFLPLVITARVLLLREAPRGRRWSERLRFRPLIPISQNPGAND